MQAIFLVVESTCCQCRCSLHSKRYRENDLYHHRVITQFQFIFGIISEIWPSSIMLNLKRIVEPLLRRGRKRISELIFRLICRGTNPFLIVAPLGLAHFATTQSCLEECVDEMKIKT